MTGKPNDDDKATTVLDIKELKKELEARQKLELDPEQFASKVNPAKKMAILFNFKTQYFDSSQEKFKEFFEIKIANDLENLTKTIKKFSDAYVFFYYNANPKAINTLIGQIKEKFHTAKTVICAEGLSPIKVTEHQNTKYKAHYYINLDDLENELKKIV